MRFLIEKSVLRANGTVYRDVMEDNEWRGMDVRELERTDGGEEIKGERTRDEIE